MSVVVVGGANVDLKARTTLALVPGTSNPGTVSTSAGGVGRNIAENLARLGTAVTLVAAVGDDLFGEDLLGATAAAGVDVSHVRRVAGATGTYLAVLDDTGELSVGVADMAATALLRPDDLDADLLGAAELVVLDGNLRVDTLARALALAGAAGVRVLLDPVSIPKAARISASLDAHPPWAITPNTGELVALGANTPADLHARGIDVVWLRRGAAGSLLSTPEDETVVPVLASTLLEVVDVTGAGDAMLAAFVHALLGGASPATAAAFGQAAAALTVASPHTVRPDLTDPLVRSLL